MKVWYSLPFLPLDVLPDLVVELERIGVEGVTVSDHVCVPAGLDSTYPYTGKQAALPTDTEFPDPIALVAALSARTSSLRFMTHVLLAALRHPVVLAKELATVSALSNGRLDVGIGVGWMKEEFDAVGIDFQRRGSITDELIEAMRLLWTGRVVSFCGTHFGFESIASRPRPAGDLLLLGGGYSAPALSRAARLDGWLGVTPTLTELSELLERLSAARAHRAAGSANYSIRTGVKGTLTPEVVAVARGLGVDALIITPHQLGAQSMSPDDLVSRSVIELSRLVEMAVAAS